MTPESFLHDWFRDCPGVIELRPLPSKAQSYHDTPGGLLKASGRCNGEAVYFGVATRDGLGGTKDNIVAIPGVWCDLDFKQTPKEEAQKLLREFPVKPTFAIASGGGWHLYWKFKEPAAKGEVPRVEAVMRGIARALKGDKSATDASRILRVPGTLNRKYDPPVTVRVVSANPERAYNPSDFDLYADAETPKAAVKSSPGLHSVVERCAFLKRCEDDAETLPEPEWYAWTGILARMPGGVDYIHEVSSKYPGYSRKETDGKILQAMNNAGPRTCAAIREIWECGKDCGVKSPAVLAVKDPAERAEKKGPEIVVLEEMEAVSTRDLLSTPTQPVDEIFAGLLARGEVLTVGGPPKGGKSYLALQGSTSAASGRDFLGFSVPRPFKVLYVLAEGSKRRFRDRLLNATPYIRDIVDEDFDRLHVVDTKGRLKIDTDAGEETLLRIAEPFDLVVLDTLYALQGGGDENSHKDFRKISGALDRLKHSGDGKGILLIHHVRKNSGEDAGADELRGAGFSGFSDAVIRLYKRKGKLGIHYELKFDLRNYEEREDLLLTRLGPLFAPIDTSSAKIDLQNHVVRVVTEVGGRIEGREALIKLLTEATKMKRQSCINAIGEAVTSGRIGSATLPGTNAKVYYLSEGGDDE